jgi:hypothetical protein
MDSRPAPPGQPPGRRSTAAPGGGGEGRREPLRLPSSLPILSAVEPSSRSSREENSERRIMEEPIGDQTKRPPLRRTAASGRASALLCVRFILPEAERERPRRSGSFVVPRVVSCLRTAHWGTDIRRWAVRSVRSPARSRAAPEPVVVRCVISCLIRREWRSHREAIRSPACGLPLIRSPVRGRFVVRCVVRAGRFVVPCVVRGD